MHPRSGGATVVHLPLPYALFVLGHDEVGRPRIHPLLFDTVVAAGLIAELIIAGALRLVGTELVPVGEPARPRRQQLALLRAIIATRSGHQLTDWLSHVASTAGETTYDEMFRAGLCERESIRRMGMFRSTRLRFADPTVPARTGAWFNDALVWSRDLDATDAVLATLGRELGELPPAYLDLTADERKARTQRISAALDESLRLVVTATRTTIAATALGTYR